MGFRRDDQFLSLMLIASHFSKSPLLLSHETLSYPFYQHNVDLGRPVSQCRTWFSVTRLPFLGAVRNDKEHGFRRNRQGYSGLGEPTEQRQSSVEASGSAWLQFIHGIMPRGNSIPLQPSTLDPLMVKSV